MTTIHEDATMKTTTRPLLPALAALLSLALAACGGGTTSSPYAGAYALDVEKTLEAAASGGASLGGGAALVQGDEAVRSALVEGMGPDHYRLDLRNDRTFTLAIGGGESPFRIDGVWGETETGLEAATRTVGGESAEQEGLPGVDRIEVEAEWLVLANEGERIYLRRL